MFIPVTHGRLEARLHLPPADPVAAAVFCHPHPLYGGSMNTRAVFRIAKALAECGLAALRFNFRGVGASTGGFDGGKGELEDVRAAIGWMRERYPRLGMVIGGFSFGSAVGMRAGAEEERAVLLMGAGVPVERGYDYGAALRSGLPIFIVQGENDEFGGPALVRELFRGAEGGLALSEVAGADHLFMNRSEPLAEAVRERFRSEEMRLLLEDGSLR